jgi:hypothetical protein
VVLHVAGHHAAGRLNASGACLALDDRLSVFETEQPWLARFRQLRIDAYGVQHAGSPTPTIRVVYGLVGLHLALDRGLSGTGVRRAHAAMGRPQPDWPRLDIPPRTELTVWHVAAAGADHGSAQGHAEAVLRWARAVWSSCAGVHGDVADLTRRLFTGDEAFWGATDTYQ